MNILLIFQCTFQGICTIWFWKRTFVCELSVDFLSSWEKIDVTRQNSSICYVGRMQNADMSSLNIRILFFCIILGKNSGPADRNNPGGVP